MRNGFVFITLATLACWPTIANGEEAVEFNRQIRPLLSQHCISCHGPDEGDREADLRLDTFEGATEFAITPGDADGSELIDRLTSEDEDLRMPPSEHAEALKPEEIELLRRWINEGAEYQTHWSFAPIQSPSAPDVTSLPQSTTQPVIHNSIDNFIVKRVHAAGLSQNNPATPRALVRRVSLDLTGLPPIAHGDEVQSAIESCLDSSSQEDYSRLVDALCDTAAYAEHWAAVWLDIARYADTCGYAGDERRDIWPWRDWLIQAIQSKKSYKDMSIEMLAGDMLPGATKDQRLATAFHRNTLSNNEGGTDDEEFRTIAVKDRLSTTLNAWMGLTVRCAECHSHKYDPISHKEYYQLLDFLNQTVDADQPDERPKLEVEVEAEVPASKQAEEPDAKTKIDVPVLEERDADQQRETFINLRGNYRSKGEKVSAEFPEAFPPGDDSLPRNRLGLARWLFDDSNPLTARVAVNRYWARLMGIGLVETEEDFGTQGTPPTHPELLDHLASEFRKNWDVRAIQKKIVLSATYQQSQSVTKETLEEDPRNRLLARGPRIRLAAEVVRDQALAVSGLLSNKLYGRPVYPPSPLKNVVNAFTGGMKWQESRDEDRYRRALYTFLKRSAPHPLFETFDMSSRDVCSMRRQRTNTPLQSFMTLNDITFIEAARALAEKMLSVHETNTGLNSSPESMAERSIRHGIETALYEPATDPQIEVLVNLYASSLKEYQQNPDSAAKLVSQPNAKKSNVDKAETNRIAEHAAMTVVANSILNLDSFLNN